MHYCDRERHNILLASFKYSQCTDVDPQAVLHANSKNTSRQYQVDPKSYTSLKPPRPPWNPSNDIIVRSSHKLFFLKHIISTYLLSYEQYRIASTSKAFYKHICNESIYNHSMFIRDAMYWNQRNRSVNHQARDPIHIDFLQTFKSMDFAQIMQLKYTVIYLHKINKYITKKHTNDISFASQCDESILNPYLRKHIQETREPLDIKVLQLATFIKPQMLMHPAFNDSIKTDSKFDNLDRFKYMCDLLQYTDFASVHNSIEHIDLSDNSLNNKDLSNILKAIQMNRNCMQFSNILTLNLSQNLFIDESYALFTCLFELIGSKFPNLSTLNLSDTGVASCAIFDAIHDFHKQFPQHPLKMINVKHCEAWFLSAKQCELMSEIPITILYDEAINNDDDNETDFEFGFDCTLTYDSDTEDEDDDVHIMKAQPLFLMNNTVNNSVHLCDNNTRSEITHYLHDTLSDESDDDDGFVYI